MNPAKPTVGVLHQAVSIVTVIKCSSDAKASCNIHTMELSLDRRPLEELRKLGLDQL